MQMFYSAADLKWPILNPRRNNEALRAADVVTADSH